MDYEASIICTVFDNEYHFQDNLLIGISHSETESLALIHKDILRVMEDFGEDKCEVENARSEYDEPITIVHTTDSGKLITHWHYYCLFNKSDNIDNKLSDEKEKAMKLAIDINDSDYEYIKNDYAVPPTINNRIHKAIKEGVPLKINEGGYKYTSYNNPMKEFINSMYKDKND